MFVDQLRAKFREDPLIIPTGTYSIVEHLVLILHASHESVLGQGVVAAAVLLISPLHLFLQCLNVGWQQAVQFEIPSLICRECRAFIVVGRAEECGSLRAIDKYFNRH